MPLSKRLKRGGRLGKYRLEARIGTGASAEVWRARDTIEGRRVAVKVVLPQVITEFGRESVEGEARIAAHLDHPNIVGIRNADWVDGRFVIVTSLAERSLEDYVSARRSVPIALSILRDVAEGLAYAHEKRLIHRDVKPANILIFEGRHAKLADFGTARLAPRKTRVLTEVGTFGYMAPEQAYGMPRYSSDVFSLALTAYQLFSGALPGWPFDWPMVGYERFQRRCPRELQAVVRKGLALSPKKRFNDGVEFANAFARAMARYEKRMSEPKRRLKATKRKVASAADPFALEVRWFRKRFGKQLAAKYDCHGCGGAISEAMKHCPWCGTDRNSFIEITRLPLVCPDCERGVRPEWKACPWCAKGRLAGNGKSPPRDRLAKRSCRKRGCEGQLQPFMRYCPECKTKVVRPWKSEGLPPCTKCRWPMAPRFRYCGWCGRKNAGALSIGKAGRSSR